MLYRKEPTDNNVTLKNRECASCGRSHCQTYLKNISSICGALCIHRRGKRDISADSGGADRAGDDRRRAGQTHRRIISPGRCAHCIRNIVRRVTPRPRTRTWWWNGHRWNRLRSGDVRSMAVLSGRSTVRCHFHASVVGSSMPTDYGFHGFNVLEAGTYPLVFIVTLCHRKKQVWRLEICFAD